MEQGARTELDRLMARLADGDRSAFDPVFEALWPVLRAFCVRALGAGDGDDAAQEAIVKVFSRASDYDRARPAAAWAVSIAAWECRTIRRWRQRRREEPAVLADGPSLEASPEETAIEAELRAAALSVLGTMRPIDVEAVAAALDGAREARGATLRKRLSRAMLRFRAAWRARHGDD